MIISNIYKFFFQANQERKKKEKTSAYKMWFAENDWFFETFVIISIQFTWINNICFVNHILVFVGGEGKVVC